MAGRRMARLGEQMKREIAAILRREVRDPRIGNPTVTGVTVTADLNVARVYVRPDPAHAPPDPASAVPEGDFLDGLAAAAPFIRRELGRALDVRRVPELRFEEDRTLDQALRIEEILRGVRVEEARNAEARSDDASSESLDDEPESLDDRSGQTDDGDGDG